MSSFTSSRRMRQSEEPTKGSQFYAIAFFNRFGGYTIEQVWKDAEHPQQDNASFAPGTVIFKLLFTDVPLAEVPYLADPLLWTVYATKDYDSQERDFKPFALIQMDLMVRDDNAPNGWVFGTYQYNGRLKADNKWEKLVPLGLQWGNDPGITSNEFTNPEPTKTRINPNLTECRINPDENELPPTHLGWNGRLNGPADNPRSSCMSCHMTAQSPTRSLASPLFIVPKTAIPEEGSDQWMRWFQNIHCTKKFDEDAPVVSTDFCLQMSMSLQNFYSWRNAGSKFKYGDYTGKQRAPDLAQEAKDYEPPVQR